MRGVLLTALPPCAGRVVLTASHVLWPNTWSEVYPPQMTDVEVTNLCSVQQALGAVVFELPGWPAAHAFASQYIGLVNIIVQ